MRRLGLIWLALSVMLGACVAVGPGPGCTLPQATTDFPGGSRNADLSMACGEVQLTILPETEPINPSPWYALEVVSERADTIRLSLHYPGYRHRYHPWVRSGEEAWRRLPDGQIEVGPAGHTATMELQLAAGSNWVSGQPLVTEHEYAAWFAQWQELRGDLEQRLAGRSVRGRSIPAFERIANGPVPSRPVVVVLGRQHPPETTGVFALKGFVDAAMSVDLPFDLIIVPVINPDGVADGYWRTNANGIDLNRDWASRSQTELQSVWHYLEQRGAFARDRLVMIDFHSTRSDRIYRDHYSDGDWRGELLDEWLQQLLPVEMDVRVTRSASGQSAKSVFGALGALAITWESGDNTSPADAEADGRAALLSLLEAW